MSHSLLAYSFPNMKLTNRLLLSDDSLLMVYYLCLFAIHLSLIEIYCSSLTTQLYLNHHHLVVLMLCWTQVRMGTFFYAAMTDRCQDTQCITASCAWGCIASDCSQCWTAYYIIIIILSEPQCHCLAVHFSTKLQKQQTKRISVFWLLIISDVASQQIW